MFARWWWCTPLEGRGRRTSVSPPVVKQTTDITMVSGGSKAHEGLSRRPSPENEPISSSDILQLLRARVIMQLSRKFGGRACTSSSCSTPPLALLSVNTFPQWPKPYYTPDVAIVSNSASLCTHCPVLISFPFSITHLFIKVALQKEKKL